MVSLRVKINDHGLAERFGGKSEQINAKTKEFMQELLNVVSKWVKHEAPHVSGTLEDSVTVVNSGSQGTMYIAAKYGDAVIDGHPTINSDKQRRFVFAMLRDKYGGEYKRKTPGAKGHVGGQPFVDKAIPHIESEIGQKCKQFENWLEDV